jgi:hypothetical protein
MIFLIHLFILLFLINIVTRFHKSRSFVKVSLLQISYFIFYIYFLFYSLKPSNYVIVFIFIQVLVLFIFAGFLKSLSVDYIIKVKSPNFDLESSNENVNNYLLNRLEILNSMGLVSLSDSKVRLTRSGRLVGLIYILSQKIFFIRNFG